MTDQIETERIQGIQVRIYHRLIGKFKFKTNTSMDKAKKKRQKKTNNDTQNTIHKVVPAPRVAPDEPLRPTRRLIPLAWYLQSFPEFMLSVEII